MNILLIGNGFDLAHELPTKYNDFLNFIKVLRQCITGGKPNWDSVHPQIKSLIEGNVKNDFSSQKEIWDELIKDNFWIDYFVECKMYQKENWIDFESEISNVIQSIDNDMNAKAVKSDIMLNTEVVSFSNEYLKNNLYKHFLYQKNKEHHLTFKDVRDRLLDDLNKFIRAFEIYLAKYVEKMEAQVISSDIRDIVVKLHENNGHKEIEFCKVLSFNYTNTCEKLYLNRLPVNYDDYMDYIHGKADINNTIESNNMVLGIDEYLSKKRKNKKVEFIAFKKFYQRIHKGTGCKYKEWVDKIQKDYFEYIQENAGTASMWIEHYALRAIMDKKCIKHYLYIFGHSLDVTDGDVLRDLILNNNVYTTIFYLNKDIMGQQIANLVKVIGQDELMRRTGGSTKTIEFRQQRDMISIENDDWILM